MPKNIHHLTILQDSNTSVDNASNNTAANSLIKIDFPIINNSQQTSVNNANEKHLLSAAESSKKISNGK